MRLADLIKRRIAILGDGVEGEAAAAAILDHASPAHVAVFSNRTDFRSAGKFDGTEQRTGPLSADMLGAFDIAIKSPGIPLRTQAIVDARANGLAVTSGTSLWLNTYPDVRTVGVTGTKGKSTTTTMIAHALTTCGRPARAVGNIGKPLLASLPPDPGVDTWVLELSSSQLADLEGRLDVAAVLNLSPEHLDWHGDTESYFAAKLRILEMAPPLRRVLGTSCPELRRRFAGRADVAWCHGHAHSDPVTHACREPSLLLAHHFGRHAYANACVAARVLTVLGVPETDITSALTACPALPHRLEPVRRTDRALWINDSLSTTPLSVLAALDAFPGRNVVLLLGGFDRGLPWDEAANAIVSRPVPPRAIITMPVSGERIAASIRGAAARLGCSPPRLLAAEDMDNAVQAAHDTSRSFNTQEAAVVLLSPGAPSYHAYKDHTHRARAYVNAIDRVTSSCPEPKP